MTAKAALVKHLLSGKTINVKTCFSLIGLTNCSREISRMIEQPFKVKIDKDHKQGNSRYGQPVVWIDYKLSRTTENADGIQKMTSYLLEHENTDTGFKTDIERRQHNKKEKQHVTHTQENNLFNSI